MIAAAGGSLGEPRPQHRIRVQLADGDVEVVRQRAPLGNALPPSRLAALALDLGHRQRRVGRAAVRFLLSDDAGDDDISGEEDDDEESDGDDDGKPPRGKTGPAGSGEETAGDESPEEDEAGEISVEDDE